MNSFLLDLIRQRGAPRTVIVLDEHGLGDPRQYRLQPWLLLGVVAGLAALFGVLLTGLVWLTPAKSLLLGPNAAELREMARDNAQRVAALEDSLTFQYQQLLQLRGLILGEIDTSTTVGTLADLPDLVSLDEATAVEIEPRTDNWEDHQQPALTFRWLTPTARPLETVAADSLLGRLRLPVLPPVDGFFARGFNARTGHFGIDLAVEEGTPVRAIGDGYVTFADWTHTGGFVVAVQHADGYLSVYMHNARLLKRVGDRVRSREAVALSGNTGEITTGPHLHFELWRNGLAQDPRIYFIGT